MIVKYIIIPWDKFNPQEENICNFINESNEVIDIITLNSLPIISRNNPKALVLMIYFQNNNLVIHDIISMKLWLERGGNFKEPLTNMFLPFNLLQKIRFILKQSIMELQSVRDKPYRYGLKINSTKLMEKSENGYYQDDAYVVISYISYPEKYNLYSIESKYAAAITNPYTLCDIENILSGVIIDPYDLIVDNLKFTKNEKIISLDIKSTYLKNDSYIKFHKHFKDSMNYLIIKSDYVIENEDLYTFLNYITLLTKKPTIVNIKHLKNTQIQFPKKGKIRYILRRDQVNKTFSSL